jgi:serine/threonine protein kinase
MSLFTGTRLRPYEILARIGGGGMGEVYSARDTRLDRHVAIKVLPEHLSQSPAALSRFERESKAVAALSHPNILALYDVGAEQGVSFAVTELLQDENLRSRLRRGAVAWREVVELGVTVAVDPGGCR